MHPAASTRRALGAVVAVVFALGLVGLAVVDTDDDGATTFASASGNGPAARANPPRPGTYRYRAGAGATGGAAMKIEADGAPGRITRQIMTLDESPEGEEGEGGGGRTIGPAALRNRVVWSKAGQHTERSEGSIGAITAGCDWKPRVPEYVFPLATGKTWSTDSTCTTSFAGQSVTLRRVERATVAAPGRVTVGGTAVDTWTINRETQLTLTALIGTRTTDGTAVEEFAPAYGLFVRQARTQSLAAAGSPSGAGPGATVELVLESLEPA